MGNEERNGVDMFKAVGRAFVVLAFMLALVSGVSYATSLQANTVYHGCYNKKTGVLRMLTRVAPRCTRNEVGISWNQTGPQGLPGPVGQQGPRGASGPQGPGGTA